MAYAGISTALHRASGSRGRVTVEIFLEVGLPRDRVRDNRVSGTWRMAEAAWAVAYGAAAVGLTARYDRVRISRNVIADSEVETTEGAVPAGGESGGHADAQVHER
jgi:hypothetical protein